MVRDVRVEVELVDPDAPRAVAAPPHDGSDREDVPARVPRGRPRRWPLAVAAAGVIGALLVTQGVLDARERALVARYAELDGVLPTVDEHVGVLWQLDDRAMSLIYTGSSIDGRLVGAWFEPSGAQHAVALDERTGEVVWSTPLAPAEELMAGTESPWVQCVTDDAAEPVVTCLVLTAHTPGPVPATPDEGPAVPVAGSAELVTLDVGTGEVVRREPAPVDLQLTGTELGLVMAWPEADGSLTVRVVDARTGTDRWQFTAPADQVGTPSDQRPAVVLSAWPHTDDVVVQSPATTWRISGDGEVLTTIAQDGDGRRRFLEPARDGSLSLLTFDTAGMTSTLVDESGAPGHELPGRPVWPTVDDGSVPGTLLVGADDGVLSAWDRRTGEPPWVNDELGGGGGVVLDGVLYATGSRDTLVAVDLASGETLWRGSSGDGTHAYGLTSPVLTDGRSILTVLRHGAGATIEAYARSDGSHLWTAPLPAGITSVSTHGDVLVGWSEDGGTQVVLG